MKLVKENLVAEVVAKQPKTAKEVLLITSKMASEQHWKRNGINRISVYFQVCNILGIDDSDLR